MAAYRGRSTWSLDDMNRNDADPIKEAGLTWGAYSGLVALVIAPVAFSCRSEFTGCALRARTVPLAAILLAILVFLGWRWRILRDHLRSGELSPAEFRHRLIEYVFPPWWHLFLLIAGCVVFGFIWIIFLVPTGCNM
jgi:hypothetical protein